MKQTSSRPALATALPVTREQLVDFLSHHRSYPDHPRSVRLVQTHASYVSITSRYVYKVKKAVNLGFLNFSTLKRRHYFCERELRLNRRLSAHVHLGIIPIFLKAGKLSFAKGGRVVEYAIQMRRLDDRYFLPRLLKRREVGRSELNRIVGALRKFYEGQRPTPEISRWGRVEKLRVSTNENFRQTEPFVGKTISRLAFDAIRHYTAQFYRGHASLFRERLRRHRIRDGHGDLRLEHIHLTPRRLSIYDCIEFSDRLRYIDWANDIAFLAMDLDHNGRPDLSQYIANRMATALRDDSLLQVIDFYKCYRAYVRGKVESLQSLGTPRVAAKEHNRLNAKRYFKQALQYAVSGSEPMVLIVMGRIASGKSTLAALLGRELGWSAFSSDVLRKELAGVPRDQKVVEPHRKHRLYADDMTDRTYRLLLRKAAEEIEQRRCVILDATYARRRHRDELRREMKEIGGTFCFVEAQAPDKVVRSRLRKRNKKVGQVSDARIEDFDILTASYQPPSELPEHALLTVKTWKTSSEAPIGRVLKDLAARAAMLNERQPARRVAIFES